MTLVHCINSTYIKLGT